MATGALDAEGVWQYGEDDDAYPVSELLNLLGGSVSNELRNDRDRLDGLETKLNDVVWTKLEPAQVGLSWFMLTSGPWDGIWYARKAGVVTITGAVQRSPFGTAAVGELILTMPVGLRPGKAIPVVTSPALQLALYADGTLKVLVSASATSVALTATYPVA